MVTADGTLHVLPLRWAIIQILLSCVICSPLCTGHEGSLIKMAVTPHVADALFVMMYER